MTGTRFIIFSIITLLLQMFVAEFINLHHLIYIVVILLPVMLLPYRYNRYFSMLIAFAIGLVADLSYEGVVGLNSAALVAVAFFREPLLRLILSKATKETLSEVNSATLGRESFILYTLLLYTIYFLFYISLDGILYFSFGYTLARLAINIILNSILILIIEYIVVHRHFGGR